MPTRQRPTKNSRHFSGKPTGPNLENNSNDYFSSTPKLRRSTSYTTPLPLGDRSELSRVASPLTRENLRLHLNGLEKQRSAPPSTSSVAEEQGHMRKSRSPKKSDKKKSKLDLDSHPLNLPPDELRRLSAAMAREEARNSTPMDLDIDQPTTNGASEPATPSNDAPGAFPEVDANGVSDRDEKSPTPPPHRVPPPKVDAEACKAAGNKYFKAKDYERAIQEYSKGKTIYSRACSVC